MKRTVNARQTDQVECYFGRDSSARIVFTLSAKDHYSSNVATN